MTGGRETFEPVDLTGRDDVREALDQLLAQVGAVFTVINRLEAYVQEELLGGAWQVAAQVYGTKHPEGGIGDDVYQRVDVVEGREMLRLLGRLAGAKAD